MEELLIKIEAIIELTKTDEELIAAKEEHKQIKENMVEKPSSEEVAKSLDASQKVFSAIWGVICKSEIELSDHESRIAFHSVLDPEFYESAKQFNGKEEPLFADVYALHKELNKQEVEPSAPTNGVKEPATLTK